MIEPVSGPRNGGWNKNRRQFDYRSEEKELMDCAEDGTTHRHHS